MTLALKRSHILAIGLLASLAASAWTYWRQHAGPELPEAEFVTNRPDARPARVAPQAPPMRAPERPTGAIVDLFGVVDWRPAAPVPSAPAPVPAPAAPTAPPLPFTYVGRTQVVGHGNAMVAHLQRGTDLYSVGEGAPIDEQYRLDKIGRDSLEITYLPLSVTQTLVIGMK